MRTWSLRVLLQVLRLAFSTLHVVAAAASATFKSRAARHLENLALRQLGVLHRSVKRRKLNPAVRLLWAWLCEVRNDRRSTLVIVKPETVIARHRKAFRLFWMESWSRPARPTRGRERSPRTHP
jgi:hypothetical protein